MHDIVICGQLKYDIKKAGWRNCDERMYLLIGFVCVCVCMCVYARTCVYVYAYGCGLD
jgi:hypothetical protein